jgi:hypothetical protein
MKYELRPRTRELAVYAKRLNPRFRFHLNLIVPPDVMAAMA